MNSWKPYLVLGIGNTLMSDDGVGVHAARILQAEPPHETEVLAIETDLLCSISFLERCIKVLVIDAMDAGQPPGALYYCRGQDLAEVDQRHSLHGMGLLRVLEFLDERHRPEVHILGVQLARTGFGQQLSLQVASVLPQVVRVVRQIIVEFGCLAPTETMRAFKGKILTEHNSILPAKNASRVQPPKKVKRWTSGSSSSAKTTPLISSPCPNGQYFT